MSSRPFFRPLLPLLCGLFALLASLPVAAQNRAIMQVSVTVVNTCQFGSVNSCALPGTRIVAAVPNGTGQPAAAASAQLSRQLIHL